MQIHFAEAKAVISLRVSSERWARAHGTRWAVFSRTSCTSFALGTTGSDFWFPSHQFQPGAGRFSFISSTPGGAAQTFAQVLTWGDAAQLHLSHPSAFPGWLPGGLSTRTTSTRTEQKSHSGGIGVMWRKLPIPSLNEKGHRQLLIIEPSLREELSPLAVAPGLPTFSSHSAICWYHLSCCWLTDFSLKQFSFNKFILKGWLNTSSRKEKLCLW